MSVGSFFALFSQPCLYNRSLQSPAGVFGVQFVCELTLTFSNSVHSTSLSEHLLFCQKDESTDPIAWCLDVLHWLGMARCFSSNSVWCPGVWFDCLVLASVWCSELSGDGKCLVLEIVWCVKISGGRSLAGRQQLTACTKERHCLSQPSLLACHLHQQVYCPGQVLNIS